MTKKYKQLSLEQRYKIEALLSTDITQTEIAKIIGVNKSTISREFKRNVPKRGRLANTYSGARAQQKTEIRHAVKHKKVRLTDSLKVDILHKIEHLKYSPEFIENQWKKDGIAGVSHETIYRFIWRCKHGNRHDDKLYKYAYKHLKHGNRRRKRSNSKHNRGLIKNRIGIENRPAYVEDREYFGDFEADLVIGKDHKSALLVLLERSTLITTINKVKGKDSNEIKHKIAKRLSRFPVVSITFDNDQAFSKHEWIAEKLNCKTYFTRPYTSQDKGSIENRNGVIRQFFPKKTDFNLIHHNTIKSVENKINNRPIRKFNYLSANEVFLQLKI